MENIIFLLFGSNIYFLLLFIDFKTEKMFQHPCNKWLMFNSIASIFPWYSRFKIFSSQYSVYTLSLSLSLSLFYRERRSKMPQVEARKVAQRKIISNKGQSNKSKSILTHLKDFKTKLEAESSAKNSDNEQLNICGNCGGDISKQR